MSTGTIRAAEMVAKDEMTSPSRPIVSNELLRGVRVTLEARLGEAGMTVEELMALKAGAVVPLSSGLADHLELYLNGTLVARGVIVAVGDKFGVRIVEVGA